MILIIAIIIVRHRRRKAKVAKARQAAIDFEAVLPIAGPGTTPGTALVEIPAAEVEVIRSVVPVDAESAREIEPVRQVRAPREPVSSAKWQERWAYLFCCCLAVLKCYRLLKVRKAKRAEQKMRAASAETGRRNWIQVSRKSF